MEILLSIGITLLILIITVLFGWDFGFEDYFKAMMSDEKDDYHGKV
jgi:hypothetical protein